MTLDEMKTLVTDTKFMVSVRDANGWHSDYIFLDYLGDNEEFGDALDMMEANKDAKVIHIGTNTAYGIIEIDCVRA